MRRADWSALVGIGAVFVLDHLWRRWKSQPSRPAASSSSVDAAASVNSKAPLSVAASAAASSAAPVAAVPSVLAVAHVPAHFPPSAAAAVTAAHLLAAVPAVAPVAHLPAAVAAAATAASSEAKLLDPFSLEYQLKSHEFQCLLSNQSEEVFNVLAQHPHLNCRDTLTGALSCLVRYFFLHENLRFLVLFCFAFVSRPS